MLRTTQQNELEDVLQYRRLLRRELDETLLGFIQHLRHEVNAARHADTPKGAATHSHIM